jgi:ribosomal protein L32
MEKIYRVVFQGLVDGEEAFQERMNGLGVPPEVVERLLRSAPVEMKRGLSLRDARSYADAVQGAGARVSIQEHGQVAEEGRRERGRIHSLKAFTQCPECGMKQLRKDVCERCGCRLETPGDET